MYCYQLTEKNVGPNGENLYTVGFYDPAGEWQPESDYNSREEAANRVAYLNGARIDCNPKLLTALENIEQVGRDVANIMHNKGDCGDPLLNARLSLLWQYANEAKAVIDNIRQTNERENDNE